MKRLAALAGKQGARIVMLVAILAVSGVFLGLAVGYPLSKVSFEESDAVRLDQSQLAGQVDPADAVLVPVRSPTRLGTGRPGDRRVRNPRIRLLR